MSNLNSATLQKYFYSLSQEDWNDLTSKFTNRTQSLLIINEMPFDDWKKFLFEWYKNLNSANFSFIAMDNIQSYFNISNPDAPERLLGFIKTTPYTQLRTLLISLCHPMYYDHLINILRFMNVDLTKIESSITNKNVEKYTTNTTIGIF